MKLNHLIFAILQTAIFSSTAFSQTINISVSASGKPSIGVDGKILKTDKDINLSIDPNKQLKIDFSKIKDATAKFSLIVDQNDAASLSLDNSFFGTTKEITADNKLNIIANGKKINLSKSFRIAVGSAKFGSSIARTFIPKINSQTPNTTVARPANELGNTASADDDNGRATDEVPYHAGSIIYDAFKLSDNANLSIEDLKIIIKYYFPDLTIDDTAKAGQAMAGNPFLRKVKIEALKPRIAKAESAGELFSSLSLSSVGGLDVTNIADGLAKFLVKRAKQELSMSFFQKFKDIINGSDDLKTLFPQTFSLLNAIDEEVYDYQKYVQNLREAFKQDIKTLPKNFPEIIQYHKPFFDNNRNLEAALRSACYIADGLENQVNPGDILENYPVNYLDSIKSSKNYKGAIQATQLFSASLRDTASDTDAPYWVPIKKIRDLINNKTAFQIYFGLLYQKALNDYDSIKFDNGQSIVALLDNIAPKFDLVYDSYKKYILGFGDKLDGLDEMIKDYSEPANDSMAIEMYAKYFRSTVDMIEYCMNIADLPFADKTSFGKKVGDLHNTLRPYFNISYAITDMATDILRKNYSAAINHAVYVYNEVIVIKHRKDAESLSASNTSVNKKIDKATTTYLSEIDKQTGKKVPDSAVRIIKKFVYDSASTTISYEVKKSNETLNNLAKYGGFMASIATAKTSNEVESTIEAFALPVGSSRIKRVSDFNVALNAYVGLFTGYEKIQGLDNKVKLNAYGLTAPIGVAASWGHHILWWKSGHEWSTSLFVSLIDLGAVAAFRFKDTVTAAVPTIQLKDIFSPGLFLSLGIPKTPLSINLGTQMGPNLRKVNVTDPTDNENPHNDYENKVYWRYSISVCVDIPVFNFYTKSK